MAEDEDAIAVGKVEKPRTVSGKVLNKTLADNGRPPMYQDNMMYWVPVRGKKPRPAGKNFNRD